MKDLPNCPPPPRPHPPCWEKDFPTLKLKHLTRYHSGKFAVGIDPDGDIDWETTDAVDTSEMEHLLASVEHYELKVESWWDADVQFKAKRMICAALACALSGDADMADKVFGEARQHIELAALDQNRLCEIDALERKITWLWVWLVAAFAVIGAGMYWFGKIVERMQ